MSTRQELRDAVIEAARRVRDENVEWDNACVGDCYAENMPDDLIEACIDLCEAVDELEAHERGSET